MTNPAKSALAKGKVHSSVTNSSKHRVDKKPGILEKLGFLEILKKKL